MSFLKLFSGPSLEKIEQKADTLFEAGLWGKAKLTYERALDKLEKEREPSRDDQQRLAAKITRAREALAREHRQNAEDLAAGGHFDDALALISLALELTRDPELTRELENQRREMTEQKTDASQIAEADYFYGLDESTDDQETEGEDAGSPPASVDEYFFALLSTLPDAVKTAYLSYGDDFKNGYIALNEGDFRTASDLLSRALAADATPESYVPLELATAYLNLGRTPEARRLLETFLIHHPETLPAYQILCEIYWEQKEFDAVAPLLASVPADLAQSLAMVLLRGETLYHAGDYPAARDYYLNFLETYGWNDMVARTLAKTHEALNDPESARGIYKEMMGRCNTCHQRIDPAIKHKYAELSFAAGMQGTDILEIYLSLAREIPDNQAAYFEKISRIYAAQGNDAEAKRFRSFAAQAARKAG